VGREARTDKIRYGSVGYMSPERLLGDPEVPAGDTYAVGAVLYELLTGSAYGRTKLAPEHAHEQLQAQLALARSLLPEAVPPALELVQDCMAYEVGMRPEAQEVAQRARALARQLPGEDLFDFTARAVPQAEQVGSGALVARMLSEEVDSSPFALEEGAAGELGVSVGGAGDLGAGDLGAGGLGAGGLGAGGLGAASIAGAALAGAALAGAALAGAALAASAPLRSLAASPTLAVPAEAADDLLDDPAAAVLVWSPRSRLVVLVAAIAAIGLVAVGGRALLGSSLDASPGIAAAQVGPQALVGPQARVEPPAPPAGSSQADAPQAGIALPAEAPTNAETSTPPARAARETSVAGSSAGTAAGTAAGSSAGSAAGSAAGTAAGSAAGTAAGTAASAPATASPATASPATALRTAAPLPDPVDKALPPEAAPSPVAARVERVKFHVPGATRVEAACGGVSNSASTSSVNVLSFPAGSCTVSADVDGQHLSQTVHVTRPNGYTCTPTNGSMSCTSQL